MTEAQRPIHDSANPASPALAWVTVGDMTMRYDDFVHALFKPEARKEMLMHAALGICSEAGEVADAIKKHCIYGKELDLENVVEELGDLRFYMQALQNILYIAERRVLQANANKLAARYPSGTFRAEDAIARKDKK